METIKCSNCGEQHQKTTSNCCWIECVCGSKICGQCGSQNIIPMDIDYDNEYDDNNYWCCLECEDCGLTGCGMCI